MWEEEVVGWVLGSWREALGGREPESIWDWRRVYRRVGVRRWRLIDSTILPAPFLRAHVLYLPRVRCNDDRLLRYLAHEAAEATLAWDGCPPYCYTADACQRHRIACMVEDEVSEVAEGRGLQFVGIER